MPEKAGKYFIFTRNQVPKSRPTILIDFDGVINSYISGWNDNKGGAAWLPDAPIAYAKEAIEELSERYEIVIFTTRAKTREGARAVRDWLTANDIHCDRITYEKEPATLIIDDRAIQFHGNWHETLEEIKNFKPWTKQRSKSTMTVLVGNIGTGKTTYAKSFEDAVIVSMDSIITAVEGSYNYLSQHRTIYHAMEMNAIEAALKVDVNVVIDKTCMTKKERARFIDMAKRHHAKVECIDFGKGNETSLSRRCTDEDSRGYSQEKWHEIHEMMMGKYEKPELSEGFVFIEDREKPE